MEAQITEDRFIEFMTLDFPSFKVTKCNLAYPTSDFVTSFYTMMIEAMTGVENTDQLTEEQCARIKAHQNEGNSFINHIYSRNIHAAVKYIISQVNPNIPEFSYSDILLPENTPRRTFVFMSFMLNCFYYFISFSEELHEEMIACEEKGREIRMRRDLKATLINQVKELQDLRTERAESLKRIKSNILKLTSSNKEKENILKELHTKENLIIGDVKKFADMENNLENDLARLENNISHFASLIVLNPNEAAEIHASNEMKKIECKDRRECLEEQVRVSSTKLSRFSKVMELQQLLHHIISKNDSYPSDSEKDFKELQKCINDLNVKLSNVKNAESKLTMQIIEKELLIPKLKSECAQLESDQAAVICKGEERCRMFKEYIENQEKIYTQMSVKLRNDADEIKEINSQIVELDKKCADFERKIKAVHHETREKYLWCSNEIKNSLNAIHTALSNKWAVNEN